MTDSLVSSANIDNSHRSRFIPADYALNMRDIGGWQAGDAYVTAGKVFRSDAHNKASDADAALIVNKLGIRTLIDLRSSERFTQAPPGVLVDHDIEIINLPFVSAAGDKQVSDALFSGGDFAVAYQRFLTDGQDAICQLINTLANKDSLPALYHCEWGKDRTGVASMIVLGLLGVSYDNIALDYSLTELVSDDLSLRTALENMESRGEIPDVELAMQDLGSAIVGTSLDRELHLHASSAKPQACLRFLAHIDQQYGSIDGYVQSIGVDDDTIVSLRQNLLTI